MSFSQNTTSNTVVIHFVSSSAGLFTGAQMFLVILNGGNFSPSTMFDYYSGEMYMKTPGIGLLLVVP